MSGHLKKGGKRKEMSHKSAFTKIPQARLTFAGRESATLRVLQAEPELFTQQCVLSRAWKVPKAFLFDFGIKWAGPSLFLSPSPKPLHLLTAFRSPVEAADGHKAQTTFRWRKVEFTHFFYYIHFLKIDKPLSLPPSLPSRFPASPALSCGRNWPPCLP